MGQYAIRRLLLLVPQALGIVTLIFVLFRLVPGDPALIVAGPNATQAPDRLDLRLGRIGAGHDQRGITRHQAE